MSERSLLLANSYRKAPFRDGYGSAFRTANVPLDLFNIFTDGQDTLRFARYRKKLSICADSDSHPPFTINVEKVRRQWWVAEIAEDMTQPGAPVAAAALIMYYQKRGFNEMVFSGPCVRVTDLRLEAMKQSEWPPLLQARADETIYPVMSHLNSGKGYLASIYEDDTPARDFPSGLRNLEREYSQVYEEDGSVEIARMLGAQSLDGFEQAWTEAAAQPTAVRAVRCLLHSGIFMPPEAS